MFWLPPYTFAIKCGEKKLKQKHLWNNLILSWIARHFFFSSWNSIKWISISFVCDPVIFFVFFFHLKILRSLPVFPSLIRSQFFFSLILIYSMHSMAVSHTISDRWWKETIQNHMSFRVLCICHSICGIIFLKILHFVGFFRWFFDSKWTKRC